jgi:hypothetical protein
LTPAGLELRSLGRPARSQSLYRLRYPNSNILETRTFIDLHHLIYAVSLNAIGKCVPLLNLRRFSSQFNAIYYMIGERQHGGRLHDIEENTSCAYIRARRDSVKSEIKHLK